MLQMLGRKQKYQGIKKTVISCSKSTEITFVKDKNQAH